MREAPHDPSRTQKTCGGAGTAILLLMVGIGHGSLGLAQMFDEDHCFNGLQVQASRQAADKPLQPTTAPPSRNDNSLRAFGLQRKRGRIVPGIPPAISKLSRSHGITAFHIGGGEA